MGTNFQFLSAEWGTFYERATKAEQLVITDPRASLAYLQKTVIVYHPRRSKVNHPSRVKVNHLRRTKVNH